MSEATVSTNLSIAGLTAHASVKESRTPHQILIDGLIAQEAWALRAFDAEFRSSIMGLARRITGNEWDAEEVHQDVLWTVHRKAASFRGDAHLQRWVNRVTHNASLMLLRKRKRIPAPVEDIELVRLMNDDSSGDLSVATEDVVLGGAMFERIQLALAEQSSTNRELFVLMDLRGLAKEDAARNLGLSVAAVKARLHRVRLALRSAADGPLPVSMA
jgi:RNA polymerase sigma-70 factor (ECF subfamily)